MGLRASIYQISAAAYEAARSGDLAKFELDDVSKINLEKDWHAIHYLVTGDSTLNFLLSGTQLPQVSEHCEVHEPASIEALHRRLSETSVSQIMANFDPATFNQLQIYPDGWSEADASYIQASLEAFLSKLKQAADSKRGFFVVIC
jgi:hypothetical protein